MPKFKKKPIEIEAIQVNWYNWHKVCEFIDSMVRSPDAVRLSGKQITAEQASDTCGEEGPDYISFEVITAHGDIAVVRHGDWITPDSKPGTFYPIKPDVFVKTYDPLNSVGMILTWEQFEEYKKL